MTFKWALINKARDYYYSGDVIVKKVEPKKVRFEVDGKEVVFLKKEKYLQMKCSCEFCALHSVKIECDIFSNKQRITRYHTICSRKMAALLYLYNKKGKIKNV